ncbi:MAG: SDR family NAD(P)-dependent oxidoreductase, partial [Novosphingobium sp.]|nr:SDR family NAD(P)-dependent oxidoreductase [Novosphingobium sp.]
MEAFRLDGKLALITGAASGIGTGIAEVLAEAGAKVVIADIDKAGAEAMAERLTSGGHKADAVGMDLTSEKSVVGAVAEVVARHGAPWLLVNNAGLQDRQLLFDETVSGWDRTLDVNARGPFLTTREAAKAMVAAGKGGRIVNIASTALINMIAKGHAAYAASKGAL